MGAIRPNTKISSYNFPEDLVPDLLCRLPIESIFKFKTVSKLWSSIIENRKLSLMHAACSSSPSSTTPICLCKQKSGDDGGEVFKLCEIKWNGDEGGVIKKLRPLPSEISCKSPRLIGSSNGVLCLFCKDETSTFILWNPLSNKFQRLPPLPEPLPSQTHAYEFGYDEVNDDYKVLCLQISWQRYHEFPEYAPALMKDDAEDRAIVYSLKSKTWRSIDTSEVGEAGVLFRDALQCLWEGGGGSHPSIVFNLSNEAFRLPSVEVEVFPYIKTLEFN